ncbi:MAG: hypothetical protein DHS20C15_30400 [Planctomycetota bacterium]|nr:MAG: hypothetical protein DHS20C15_30400 [Planctomycetota bacterium]
MNTVVTLAKKDIKVLLRDKFAMFWIVIFPLGYAVFFGTVFGDSGGPRAGMYVALVDEDGSAYSQAVMEQLAAHDAVLVDAEESGALLNRSLDEARELVQKGQRTAYLRLPAGFGENPYALFGGASGDGPQLELGIDPGRQAEAGMLQGVVMETVFGALQERMLDTDTVLADLGEAQLSLAEADDVDPTQKFVLTTFLSALKGFVSAFDMGQLGLGTSDDADGADATVGGFGAPLAVVDVTRQRDGEPRSPYDITMPQGAVWGLLSVALGFGITLVRERSSGTLVRLRMAPVSHAQLLGGKALACFTCCVGSMVLAILFGTVVLGLRVDRPDLLVLAMFSTAIAFTGLMMTVSVMGKTEAAVAGSSWGLTMPFAMIGGGMIPLMFMPEWLQDISVVSPVRWAIISLEGAIWRDFGWADMATPSLVLIGFGAGFFALGVFIFRRTGG